MTIKPKTVEIVMTGDEVYTLAFTIKHDLEESIENHWNCLQQGKDGEELFFKENMEQLKIMQQFFEVSGYGQLFGQAVYEFKQMFEVKRAERAARQAL